MSRVFWAVLLERAMDQYGVNALLNVAMQCGAQEDFTRLSVPYMRTDTARNMLTTTFLDLSNDPNDTLIMLDCDHIHPIDVVVRLARQTMGVVGALYFRRSEPYDPLMFTRGKDGLLRSIVKWDTNETLIPCTVVATGGIAIKRWVFDRLKQAGIPAPYFRYVYQDDKQVYSTEDVYFGEMCEKAGIPCFCDTSIILPHITAHTIDDQTWQEWANDHQDQLIESEETVKL